MDSRFEDEDSSSNVSRGAGLNREIRPRSPGKDPSSPGEDPSEISELDSARDDSDQSELKHSSFFDRLDENIRLKKEQHYGDPKYDRWHVPEEEDLEYLMNETDIDNLKLFIRTTFKQISGYNFLIERLAEMLHKYGVHKNRLNSRYNVNIFVDDLEEFLEDLTKKLAMFDVSVRDVKILQGSNLLALLDKSKSKLFDLIAAVDSKVRECNLEIKMLENELVTARAEQFFMLAEIESNQIYIQQIKDEMLPDIPPEEEFIRHMEVELNMHENLNSTLQERNQALMTTNERLETEISQLMKKNAAEHQERVREIAEIVQDTELNEGLMKSVTNRINELATNPDEVQTAVTEWMEEIGKVIEEKKNHINDINKTAKELDEEIVKRQAAVDELKKKERELDRTLDMLKDQTQQKDILLQRSRAQTDESSDTFHSTQSRLTPRTPRFRSRIPISTRSATKRFTPDSLRTLREVSPDSPDFYRGGCSSYDARDGSSTSSMLIESTPEESPLSDSGPSPYHLNAPSPLLESYEERFAPGTQTLPRSPRQFAPGTQTLSRSPRQFAPGTQTLSRSPRQFAPEIRPIDPSTQNVSGSSRFPSNIRPSMENTPNQYVTPFISHSRYGYTGSPTNILNVPPGDDIPENRGLKKTIVLTSPKRKDPLLVNIDIDPKPLTQTPSGEHFICDISLALQQADDRRKYRHLKPVFTFDEPPAQTPTTARRHFLFTPRGIFKRRHYNVRRVHKPYEYQSPNLPWSPHNLSDARSPISQLYPSPYISDSSISWERSPGTPYGSNIMNRTFDASPASAMNRTFNASTPYAMNRTFNTSSPSAMNRTFNTSVSSVFMDRTFDVSPPPSAMNRTFNSSVPSVFMDRTFDVSPPPSAMSRTFNASSPSAMNRTFNTSVPSVFMDRTFDVSPPPSAMNRTFDSSVPSVFLDRTFDVSPPPSAMNRTFDSSVPSTAMNRTYEKSPSPEIAGPSYGRKLARSGRAYDNSPSPVIRGPSYGRQSPASSRTLDSSPSPITGGRSFGMQSPGPYNSGSPASGYVADSEASPSPAIEEPSYTRGMREPAFNRTFEKSSSGSQSPYNLYSPRYNSSRDSSRSSHLSQSPSPSLNRTYDRSVSPPKNVTFARSPSPQLNKTYDKISPLDTAFLGEDEQQ